MRIQRAQYEDKSAPLSSEFGRKVAAEKFGEELVASFPVFSRGPRKGQLKGLLCWRKCSVGGWSHSVGGVVRPGTSAWRLTMAYPDSDPNGHAVVAEWDYNGGKPIVSQKQTPADAAKVFKAYGTNKRYG